MNRLAQETSPYLRQHKDNPVDWWPWCPEAFDEARRLDRPVLLSIGYSACTRRPAASSRSDRRSRHSADTWASSPRNCGFGK